MTDTTVNEADVLHLVGVGALPPSQSAPNPSCPTHPTTAEELEAIAAADHPNAIDIMNALACPICHGTGVETVRTTPTCTATRACPRCFPTP